MAYGFHHLTRDERCQIYALRKSGVSFRGIARDLRYSPSTISREVRRNSGRRGYRFKQADQLACERRHLASCRPRKMSAALWRGIEERLAQQWSPEQIAGRLRLDGIVSVSPSWIYRHVWSDRAAGGYLYRNLRRRGKKANRRGRDGAGRGVIPGRVDIEERPAVVEEKSRIGDWEADTIIGAGHQGALVSLVDRASKYTLLQQVPQKTATAVSAAIAQCLLPFVMLVHTITAEQRQGVCWPPVARAAPRHPVLLRPPVSLLGKGIERAYQRPGAAILPEIDRSADNRCARGPAGTGPAQQQTAQIARLPDPGGGVPPGAGCR